MNTVSKPATGAPNLPPLEPHNNINLNRTAYGFEYTRKFGIWLGTTKSEEYFKTFLINLGLTRNALKFPALRLLRRYTSATHENAQWYNWRVERERWIQRLYFILSLVLMFAVPILIFKAPELLAKVSVGTSQSTDDETRMLADTIGMVTALLTGILAVHRSISGWLGQRKLIGPYWQARSKLLDQIYTLETQWGGFDINKKVQPDGKLTPEFRAAIISGIRASRSIVREENDKFFENYQFPNVDIAAGIKAQMGVAKELTKAFESPSLTAAQSAGQAEQTRRTAAATSDAEIKALDAVIAKLVADRDALEERLPKIQNSDLKPEAVAELKALNSEIRKLKSQRITAEINLRKNQI